MHLGALQASICSCQCRKQLLCCWQATLISLGIFDIAGNGWYPGCCGSNLIFSDSSWCTSCLSVSFLSGCKHVIACVFSVEHHTGVLA